MGNRSLFVEFIPDIVKGVEHIDTAGIAKIASVFVNAEVHEYQASAWLKLSRP